MILIVIIMLNNDHFEFYDKHLVFCLFLGEWRGHCDFFILNVLISIVYYWSIMLHQKKHNVYCQHDQRYKYSNS